MSIRRRGTKLPPAKMGGTIKAGILSGATYPADTIKDAKTGKTRPDPRAGMPVAVIAAALNYGTSDIPARPFMSVALEQRQAWVDAFVKLIKGGASTHDAMSTVGLVMKEDIKFAIVQWPADNSPEWAESKGFNKGLIFTSHLLNSVESEVEDGS